MPKIEKLWLEEKADRLIQRAKRSQFADDIFRDSREYLAEGYVCEVALMLALRLWEGHPQTGEVSGV